MIAMDESDLAAVSRAREGDADDVHARAVGGGLLLVLVGWTAFEGPKNRGQ